MRLLHAVLLSVVIVLALDVGLLQARALDDDETDVSAGDVHPSRETAIDEESRSLFTPSFTANFKSFFGKLSPKSKTASKATKVQAARRVDDTANMDPIAPSIDKIVSRWKNERDIGTIFKSHEEYLKLSQAVGHGNLRLRKSNQVTGADVLISNFDGKQLETIVTVASKHTLGRDNFGELLLDDMLKAWSKKNTPKSKLPIPFQKYYDPVLKKREAEAETLKIGPIDEHNLI